MPRTHVENACCVWDITIPEKDTSINELRSIFKKMCKKWGFQLEAGDKTGYRHYQCRISLKVKQREGAAKDTIGIRSAHFTPTSSANQGNLFYVFKEDTRIDGPWCDTDVELYIPRQYRGLVDRFYPWQKTVWDQFDTFDPRRINVVFDPIGDQGKSTLAALAELLKNGYDLPPENDGLKLIQSTCNMLMAKEDRTPGPIFIDLPRSMDQTQLFGLYKAIEQIKKGKVYDMRNHYKQWWYDSPQVWVFCNTMPETGYVSRDRWKFFTITKDKALADF